MTVMRIEGLGCEINTPRALLRQFVGGEEQLHQLPPYAPRPAYSVADYAAARPEWIRGSAANHGSYFVPVDDGDGLWLDFNSCWDHTHHVAIVVSIQGVNAITGLPTDGLYLEQYKEKCPRHDEPFESDRFCASCNYKWPAQNYLATTVTERNRLWIDGFRAADGVIRQFVFTAQQERSIARSVLGEDRSYALGIGFFLSVAPKPEPVRRHVSYTYQGFGGDFLGGVTRGGGGILRSANSLEVAAGARVHQRFPMDTEDLAFWRSEPAGLLYVNYADVEEVRSIVAAGRVDRTAGGEGFLAGLPHG